jgi:hypothetical protein
VSATVLALPILKNCEPRWELSQRFEVNRAFVVKMQSICTLQSGNSSKRLLCPARVEYGGDAVLN